MRRLVGAAIAAGLVTSILLAPSASATSCTFDVDTYPVDVPPVTHPCPGPDDQPLPAPIWVTTNRGPGYNGGGWWFIKVARGSQIIFANVVPLTDGTPYRNDRFHGSGFDSGIVAGGEAQSVAGVNNLSPGVYPVYNIDNAYVADLHIEDLPF